MDVSMCPSGGDAIKGDGAAGFADVGVAGAAGGGWEAVDVMTHVHTEKFGDTAHKLTLFLAGLPTAGPATCSYRAIRCRGVHFSSREGYWDEGRRMLTVPCFEVHKQGFSY